METKWKFCQQLLNFHKFFLRLSTVQRSTMYTSIQSAISSVFFWGGGEFQLFKVKFQDTLWHPHETLLHNFEMH